MVVVAYGVLLPQDVLDAPRYGCINIHASLLPRWRGAAPIQRAIEAGDLTTGVSIMKMDAGLDTGPVLQKLETPIGDQDTSADLHDRLAELGAAAISTTLAQIAHSGMPALTNQDNDSASYANKVEKAEARIDWSQSASQLQRRVRAFNPWPICHSTHRDTRIRVWQSSHHSADPGRPAGEILQTDDAGIYVACGQGVLRLEVVQRDGGKALPWAEFANGYAIKPGEKFV